MAHHNVEIKARSANNDAIRDYLAAHKAEARGTDHQIDTYFNVPDGRLKLRIGTIENNLIFYRRNNQAGPKQSAITLCTVPHDSEVGDVLTAALGAKVVVDKVREIYFIDNVKFHLDTVNGLGQFMEIEAIDYDGTIGVEDLDRQCNHYMNELGINTKDLLTMSYSDMLLDKADK